IPLFPISLTMAIQMLPIESPESLSTWLTKELSPICDADPGALAKYVLALLKKPLPADEIKGVCMLQLEVFLQSHTKRFVERLFTALAEKTYMDAPADPPASVAVAVVEEKKEKKEEKKEKKKEAPKEKQTEEKKEKSKEKEPSPPHSASASQSSSSVSNERSRRAQPSSSSTSASKREGGSTSDSAAPSTSSTRRSPVRAPRKRVSPPPQLSRRRSRSPPGRGTRRVGGVRRSPIREKRRSRSRSPIDKERRRERGERDDEQPRRKKRCRDFDEQGVCLRGEACPYDHGLDPVVVENAALAAMGLKTAAAVATSSYSVPPPGYNPLPTNPPPPGVEGVGYNPEAPGMGMSDFSVPPPPIPVAAGWRQPNPYGMPPQVGYEPSGSIPVDPHNGGMMGGMGGIMRGRGRGRGRGGFHPYGRGGLVGGERVAKEGALEQSVAARTLIVKKIPAELNNISKLNEHFEQFGSITNMQVHYERQPDTALITFSSRFEATKAYKNPEPIFNNRFIRVFWYSNVTEGGPNKTTLSSGVTVETPEGNIQAAHVPVAPREPVVLPGPGQTKYRKPEAVEAFKKKQEEAAARKADKEAVLRHKDLLKRALGILSSLQDQQKQVIMAMMKETDVEKKKTLNKMYKQLDGKIATQKADVEEQQEKMKTLEAKAAKNATEASVEGGSSGDEVALSPEEGTAKADEEDDLLSAQVDEDFAAIK
ncbi:hypothetical protein PMAYCL1PPCAC_12059, partial [Pristionchus mayeri]